MHELVIILAKYFIVLSLLIIIYVWITLPTNSEKKRFIAQAIIGGFIALVLLELGKHTFYNARPFVMGHFTPFFPHGNDNGFPSEHALFTFYAAFLAYKYNPKAAYVLFVIALVVSGARMAAGIHHAIDILGAMIFSAIAAGASIKIVEHSRLQKYFTKQSSRPNSSQQH